MQTTKEKKGLKGVFNQWEDILARFAASAEEKGKNFFLRATGVILQNAL
jgi:hypothetical protein